MNNQQIAQVFANIADLLEIKGEVIYKVLAYRRAAESLRDYSREVRAVWQEGKLRDIPAVGAAIEEKINELLATGKLNFYERLRGELPEGLVDVLAVPDVGPKKVAMFWKKLGVTNVPELEAAARAGKLRDLPGMGEKSEAKILAGIESLAKRVASGRRHLSVAWPIAQEVLAFLRGLPGVERAEAAGSLRRRRSTIGDLDFLVAAAEADPIMEAFCQYPSVARVLGHGPTKSSVEFGNGLQADLRVLPPERFGTLLQYFTGSKDHNVKIRELALRQTLSLNEHAFTKPNGDEILCATEEEVYGRLGLSYIPPELREDRGEIEAAARGTLPTLVTEDDLISELHSHSTWSDGALTILAMARAARERGLKLLAVTDHSYSLGITGGLTPEKVVAQRQEIDAAQKELGRGLRLLQGAEVEIKSTGQLDFGDEVLASLDVVVASLHTSLRQPREQITARLLSAVQNRHVDIIGHPTGRLFPDREGADLDMEAILQAAAQSGVALEINANPMRLDLDDVYAQRALQLGCLLSINTDAHHASELDLCHFGVGIARRAWATPEQVINTWPEEKLLRWLKARGDGNGARPAVVNTEAAPAGKKAASKKPAARKPAAKRAAKKSAVKKPAAKPGRKRG